MSQEPKAWTIILEDAEATDKQIVALGKRLVESAAEAGYSLRAITVQSWLFRARMAPPEPFSEAPKMGPGQTHYMRRNHRGMGIGPSG